MIGMITLNRGRKLRGREREIVKIIKFFEDNKCIWLTGEQGIGKSAIAQEIAHLIFDRDYFKDGVLYLSLEDIEDLEGFIKLLFKVMRYSLRIPKEREELQSKLNSELHDLYDFCLHCIKDLEILIVFDNIDRFSGTLDFQPLIADLFRKIRNSWIVLTAEVKFDIVIRKENKIDILDSKEVIIKGLSSKWISDLIKPPHKNVCKFNKEVITLWKETGHVNKKNETLDPLKHDLFTLLKGNPLWALLVSSNANSKSFM